MENMSEESKEVLKPKKILQTNDLLMKPFNLGWTREVVKRVITKNRAPNCDIYYFSPSKKRIRSLTELKNILTDGLSPECFSFKREPLGLSPDLEIIRDAKLRGKKFEKFQTLKKKDQPNNTIQENNDNENEIKGQQNEIKDEASGEEVKKKENEETQNESNTTVTDELNSVEKHSDSRPKRIKNNEKVDGEINNVNSKKKSKRKAAIPTAPVKLSLRRRKSVLKKILRAKQAKQTNPVSSTKTLKRIVRNMVKPELNQKLSKKKNIKKTELKSTKNKKLKLKSIKKPLKSNMTKTKNETVKVNESNETDKKSVTRDLKSIVKKNIGKYREMREKQKLGAVKNQMNSSTKKKTNAPRLRSEPISKNKLFYLKPLERGWRRELVYRSNSATAGQRADVYYFHPNGKKLRSCREIAENLTQGLSIECFTFRKEPIGCGEPSEVVRNARFIQKN